MRVMHRQALGGYYAKKHILLKWLPADIHDSAPVDAVKTAPLRGRTTKMEILAAKALTKTMADDSTRDALRDCQGGWAKDLHKWDIDIPAYADVIWEPLWGRMLKHCARADKAGKPAAAPATPASVAP